MHNGFLTILKCHLTIEPFGFSTEIMSINLNLPKVVEIVMWGFFFFCFTYFKHFQIEKCNSKHIGM